MLTAVALTLAMKISFSPLPPTGTNDFYVGNRAPMAPSAFRKLPIGAIRPEGWVRKQLELQADGFVGHLTEISPWLEKKNNAWLSPTGEGDHGWEEVPYWLKGFGDLGYILGDERIKREAKTWIDGVIASQREDGYFGPRGNLVPNNGNPDVWPNMVMLNALQTWYEFSGDERVIRLMERYFRWQLALPDESLLLSYWEKHRGGDNMASVYWLYNRTGESWLLDLVRKLHRRGADWVGGIPDWHGVNFAQAFREPATFGVLSHDAKDYAATEKNWSTMRAKYGRVPGGMYGADENARPGFADPRQAAETCAMVETMLSDQLLLTWTGDPIWADRCEDVTFNSLPASMTPDLKALHYLTSPNMPLVDARSKAPGLQNGGPMLLFDPHDHRCCQHNVSHGWPYYAEHLWLATAENGLGVAMYAPSTVTAKVGDGTTVTIHEETEYPFDEKINFRLALPKPVTFPLVLRIPSWCPKKGGVTLRINGVAEKLPTVPEDGNYLTLRREWHDGDRLEVRFEMVTELTRWPDNHDSVSVQRGPLTYSLAIKGDLERAGGTDNWPAFQLLPKSSWNYGLLPDLATLKVKRRPMPKTGQPFDHDSPISITGKARRIPEWQLDSRGLVTQLQPSPARAEGGLENVTLIPMGAARLRISAFPTVSIDGEGHPWTAPPVAKEPIPAASSHTFAGDTTDALSDGLMPTSSHDETVPRFTWWDHKGSAEWVEYDFKSPRAVGHAEVYWFDDRSTGGECRVPESWRLLAWVDGAWKLVSAKEEYGVQPDCFNVVHFDAVLTTKVRLEAQLRPGFSAGILEWVVH